MRRMKFLPLVLTAIALVLGQNKYGSLNGSKTVTSQGQMRQKTEAVREKFMKWKVS